VRFSKITSVWRKRSSRWWCFSEKIQVKWISAAYATRHIAKNLVAAGVADEILVQVSYAIGLAKPMGIFIDTYGTSKLNLTNGEIAKKSRSYL
jgi:S-adenosylmethionine synthetase